MEDKQLKLKKKAQKFIDNNGNPVLAQLDATIEIADKIDELTQAVKSIPQTEIPEPPEMPEVDFSETNRLLQDLLAESKKKEQSEEITYSISPSDQAKLRGKDGKDGKNGKDGLNGLNGKDGKDGKDGSPDTRKQIVDKINGGGPEKIKASEITGLPQFTREVVRELGTTFQTETPLKAGTNITITKDAQGANVISALSGSSVSFGTTTQIPYMNVGGTDFIYSSNLTFDGSLQKIISNSLGVTQVDTKGLYLVNTTAAAAGAQQISPAIRWEGQGWRTTATAESRPVDFRAYVYTYQGSTNPNGMWFLDSSVNGGTYTQRFGVGLNGDLYLSSGGSGTSGQVLQSGGASVASSWLTLNSIATAGLSSGSGTTASGNSVNWAGTLTTAADINANDSYRVMISNIAANHAGISYATNEPKVTWDIDGSWGLRRRLVDNTEHTVEYFDSIISVKTDSSTGAVVLPDASTSTGRIITVKFYDNTSVYNIGVSASSGNVQSASDFSLGGSYSMPITGQRAISWQSNGTDWEIVWTQGIGDVVGSASATDNNVVFFDGTTGKLIKDSGLTLSGSNTGDQTSIVGITGTKAQFDTACTDGNFLYVGDITQYTDEMAQDAVGTMVTTAFTYTDLTPQLALTSRTIGGVAYDGTANITVATATGGFTVSGGNLALGTNSLTLTGSIASTGSRVTKGWFTDLESTNMPIVGGTSLSSIFQGLDTQLTSLAGLSYTGNALKVIRVNAGETDFELATLAGGSGLTHPEVMSRVSLRF